MGRLYCSIPYNLYQNSSVPMSGTDGIDSSTVCQGGELAVNEFASGIILGSPSKIPAGMDIKGHAGFDCGKREPQVLQNARLFPGDDS